MLGSIVAVKFRACKLLPEVRRIADLAFSARFANPGQVSLLR